MKCRPLCVFHVFFFFGRWHLMYTLAFRPLSCSEYGREVRGVFLGFEPNHYVYVLNWRDHNGSWDPFMVIFPLAYGVKFPVWLILLHLCLTLREGVVSRHCLDAVLHGRAFWKPYFCYTKSAAPQSSWRSNMLQTLLINVSIFCSILSNPCRIAQFKMG